MNKFRIDPTREHATYNWPCAKHGTFESATVLERLALCFIDNHAVTDFFKQALISSAGIDFGMAECAVRPPFISVAAILDHARVVMKSHCYRNFGPFVQKTATSSFNRPLLMSIKHYLKNSEETETGENLKAQGYAQDQRLSCYYCCSYGDNSRKKDRHHELIMFKTVVSCFLLGLGLPASNEQTDFSNKKLTYSHSKVKERQAKLVYLGVSLVKVATVSGRALCATFHALRLRENKLSFLIEFALKPEPRPITDRGFDLLEEVFSRVERAKKASRDSGHRHPWTLATQRSPKRVAGPLDGNRISDGWKIDGEALEVIKETLVPWTK
ncbi:hypothetical protein EVAR_41690_1 [Eumeta japonica]|uniref:Uncharacterized protein n=1 Tax=Eumeta variegata TaxID=151549 RepID=A0A4C1VPZ3_EUMVA|nr:hypothetical protein EVAR_41690_1 [Eumeta japonica]